jgi:hypothetical protein
MTGMNPVSAHFDSGQALHMLLSTYCQMDLPLLTGMHFLWFEKRKRVLNRYCRNPSYSECFAGKTFDLYS